MRTKKLKIASLCVAFFVLGGTLGVFTTQYVQHKKNELRKEAQEKALQFKLLGKTLEKNLGLAHKNNFEKAIIIRNHLYKMVPTKENAEHDFFDILNSYYESVYNPNVGHICQGMQIIYMIALRSQNIPSRRVQLFDK
ncbi:MAG: hypothetical protein H6925_03545 [Holosporaceae bacterium]|nr:MAG: hypothetical protein H6925_03545 [Holosporaceae bacterium]